MKQLKKMGKNIRRTLALGLAAMAWQARATTYELNVPTGTTNDLKTVLEAALAAAGRESLVDNDVLVKTGGGRLIGTNLYQSIKAKLHVYEGIYEARYKGDMVGENMTIVSNGASVVFNNKMASGSEISSWRTFYLQGAGHPDAAVSGGRTGALVFIGGNYQILNNATFILQADTTFAMDTPQQLGMFTNAKVDQQSKYRLTLLGGGHTLNNTGGINPYQFRFRYGWGFTNGYEVVCDGGALAAHATTYSFLNGKPWCTMKNGGAFAPDGQNFVDGFSKLVFEPGTFFHAVNAASFSTPPIVGVPYFTASVTPTVNNLWTLRGSDLVGGHAMGAWKALTFGANAQLKLQDADDVDAGVRYVVATSKVSVFGLPTYVYDATMSRNWKTEAGADGKSVLLVYDPPVIDGLVNVRDWGVRPGVENAAANSSAFAAGLAALEGTGHVVFFPQGRYFFDAPIALANQNGLTLLGDRFARLAVTDAEATSVISVSGGSDVTVTDLVFADCAGVAVAANGVAGLAVTNNVYTNVVGAIADVEGVYPVSALDSTGVLVCGNTVKGGTIYAGPVYVGGTTVLAAGCEPTSDEVVFFVDRTIENELYTREYATALAEKGLSVFPQGAKLVKTGIGRLKGSTAADDRARFGSFDIREGTYISTSVNALGASGTSVTVQDGATLLLETTGDGMAASNTKITLGARGAASAGGSPLCIRSGSWQATQSCTYTLTAPTRFRSLANSTMCALFNYATLDQNGHQLVLSGEGRDTSYRFRLQTTFKNPAPIICSNVTISASYKESGSLGFRCAVAGQRPPLLKFAKDAKLLVNNQDFADVFEVYEFEPGAQYNAESAGKDLTTKNLKGLPTVLDNVASLTVTNAFTVAASDLVAEKKLTAAHAFGFGANCTFDVEGIADLPIASAGYVVATATDGITGKPQVSAALKAARWTIAVTADGKSLVVRPAGGTTILVR